jgi:hypothetical protein
VRQVCDTLHVVDEGVALTISRPRGRALAVRAFVVLVLVVHALLLVRSYWDPHNFFGFQPFNESSTWRADVVRVTAAGERVPVEAHWPGGYDWDELVGWGVLERPDRLKHAYSGLDASVDFLDEALDWVADSTPRDTQTLYLEARVTGYRNGRGPEQRVLRSAVREEAS